VDNLRNLLLAPMTEMLSFFQWSKKRANPTRDPHFAQRGNPLAIARSGPSSQLFPTATICNRLLASDRAAAEADYVAIRVLNIKVLRAPLDRRDRNNERPGAASLFEVGLNLPAGSQINLRNLSLACNSFSPRLMVKANSCPSCVNIRSMWRKICCRLPVNRCDEIVSLQSGFRSWCVRHDLTDSEEFRAINLLRCQRHSGAGSSSALCVFCIHLPVLYRVALE
jgi:hypothetical protein